MKNTLSIVILIIIICLPSTGQICVLDENGRAFYSYGGIANLAEELFLYRDIYGEYPKNKKMLLDFILSEDRYDSTDSLLFHDQISIRRKTLTKLLKNRRNKLTISRDTCSFYVAKKRTTIRNDENEEHDDDDNNTTSKTSNTSMDLHGPGIQKPYGRTTQPLTHSYEGMTT